MPIPGSLTVTQEHLSGHEIAEICAFGLPWDTLDCEICSLKICVSAVQPSRAAAKNCSTNALRNEAQPGGVDQPNVASIDADQLHSLQLGKLATQGLRTDAEIARDVFAGHRQPKLILRRLRPAQAGVYVDQKRSNPLLGTESRPAHTLPREFAAHKAPDPGVQALKLRA